MPFWRHRTAEEQAAQDTQKRDREELTALVASRRQTEIARQASDLVALAQGGIPTEAKARLSELGASHAAGETPLYTSDLSPDEAALLRRHDYTPVGLVTGSCMYHVGTAYVSRSDCEVPALSHAYNEATRLAVSRLQQESVLAGAHGVVGVRYTIVRHEWGDKSIEVRIVGTALRGPGPAPRHPWMSDLSGQKWWSLHRAGYEPVSLVYGHSTWFVFTTQYDEWNEGSGSNIELTHFAQALSHARTSAAREVTTMARAHGASGVVGMHISRRLDEVRLTGPGEDPAYEREHHNLVISMIGTGIKARDGADTRVPRSSLVISLRDGRMIPLAVRQGADATFA